MSAPGGVNAGVGGPMHGHGHHGGHHGHGGGFSTFVGPFYDAPVQEVRVIPTVPIAGSEAPQAAPPPAPAPAPANGAAVMPAAPARDLVPVPAQGGVG